MPKLATNGQQAVRGPTSNNIFLACSLELGHFEAHHTTHPRGELAVGGDSKDTTQANLAYRCLW
jgi:hypothetical protein